jgi:uncharacterized protein YbjT (DUF2867 family)
MTKKTIAVVGAAGRTGLPLVSALLKSGLNVRGISRRASQPGLFPQAIEVRCGDSRNLDSLAAAFEGADAIHYIPPSFDPGDPDYAKNIIEAARKTGITRLVYHSVMHPATPEMPHHFRKTKTEQLLRHSPLTWTIIQPGMYAQTALAFFNRDTAELMPAFDVSKPFTPIHERDLAEAAAIIHATEGHAFATYELASTELLNFAAMGETLSGILGRPVETHKASAEKLAAFVASARGYNPEQVRELCLMFDHYDLYGLAGNGNILRMILGREPSNFAQAMNDSLKA